MDNVCCISCFLAVFGSLEAVCLSLPGFGSVIICTDPNLAPEKDLLIYKLKI